MNIASAVETVIKFGYFKDLDILSSLWKNPGRLFVLFKKVKSSTNLYWALKTFFDLIDLSLTSRVKCEICGKPAKFISCLVPYDGGSIKFEKIICAEHVCREFLNDVNNVCFQSIPLSVRGVEKIVGLKNQKNFIKIILEQIGFKFDMFSRDNFKKHLVVLASKKVKKGGGENIEQLWLPFVEERQ